MTQATPLNGSREVMKRGKEHDTMPYFLTDQFRMILEASKAAEEEEKTLAEENAEGGKKKAGEEAKNDKGPVGLYKSMFLRNKVEQ